MITLHPLRPPTTAPVFPCYRYATALPIAPATAMLPTTTALPTFPPTPPQAVAGPRARIPTGVQDRLRWRSARSQTPPRGRHHLKTIQPRHNSNHRSTIAAPTRTNQASAVMDRDQTRCSAARHLEHRPHRQARECRPNGSHARAKRPAYRVFPARDRAPDCSAGRAFAREPLNSSTNFLQQVGPVKYRPREAASDTLTGGLIPYQLDNSLQINGYAGQRR
jgi:hypothetical protein